MKPTFSILASMVFGATLMAQIPNYVPQNGLVGWWPFNGNANDESGNGNHGTVNGAMLANDRLGNVNKAYNFNGTSDFISIPDDNSLDLSNQFSIAAWINIPDYTNPQVQPNGSGAFDYNRTFVSKPRNQGWASNYELSTAPSSQVRIIGFGAANMSCCPNAGIIANTVPLLNTWHYVAVTYNGFSLNLYIDGVLDISSQAVISLDNSSEPLYFGKAFTSVGQENWYRWFKGKIDDIGIWNRALTQQEITALYNSCQISFSTQPLSQTISQSQTAQFSALSSDPNATYQWQSDVGFGFQNLNNVGQYSGVNTGTLSVSNVSASNNNQPFRCVVSAGSCTDTSQTALLSVNGNVSIEGHDDSEAFSIFPNPSRTQVTISFGKYANKKGHSVQIVNALGQTMYSTSVSQEASLIDVSAWSANGLYYVQILDANKEVLETRKLLVQ